MGLKPGLFLAPGFRRGDKNPMEMESPSTSLESTIIGQMAKLLQPRHYHLGHMIVRLESESKTWVTGNSVFDQAFIPFTIYDPAFVFDWIREQRNRKSDGYVLFIHDNQNMYDGYSCCHSYSDFFTSDWNNSHY
ncbi:MAG: hypothetical protein IH591_17970 [Bacteroidales bacterium]|nr:hypothetical protein [Bacteroidales bacterium]